MEFLDYEKIIRDHYPMLIESYVNQYGEKYRERIVNVLDRIKYCFFVTPSNIEGYVKVKSREDYMKGILDSFLELGLDVSSIRFKEDCVLECSDPKLSNLLVAFFPDLSDIENFKKKGLYAFRNEYDGLDISDDIIKERMILLEKLKMKDESISYQDYYNNPKYKSDCLFVKQYLKVFERNINKWVGNYDDLLAYADDLEEDIIGIGRVYEIEFLKAIREILPDEDLKILDSDEEYDVRDLDCYGLFFDLELAFEDYCFTDGPIDHFLDYYTEKLLDKDVSFEEKENIVKMRLNYLDDSEFEIKYDDISELFCDWYEIEEFKDFLPDKDTLNKIVEIKDKYAEMFEMECANLCIINDYVVEKDDAVIGTITEEDGHSCSLYQRDENLDTDNFSCVACLNPFMDTYNLFDIAIDHELRHAIEWRIKPTKLGLLTKIGCDVFNFESEEEQECFTDINERITHKLSVEATRERWENGEFIFSDKYALITDYPCSIYDYDFDNLEVIFEPFREKIIEAQISPIFTKIYETIPKKDLRKVNSLITSHDKGSFRKLNSISKRLQQREEDKKNTANKVKKIGGQSA